MRTVGIVLLIIVSLTLWNFHQGNASEWDPTRPYGMTTSAPTKTITPSAPRTALHLTAIFYSSKASKAVIDGITVTPGQTVKGCRVMSIDAQTVVLKDSQGLRTLKLHPKGIKQPHRTLSSAEGAS